MKYIVIALFVLSGISCSQSPETTSKGSDLNDVMNQNKYKSSKNLNYKNEYLIHIESKFNESEMQEYLKKYNIKIISKLTKNKYSVKVDPDLGIDEMKKQIKSSKYIKYIELNHEYKLMR
jgi:hypothetical protein